MTAGKELYLADMDPFMTLPVEQGPDFDSLFGLGGNGPSVRLILWIWFGLYTTSHLSVRRPSQPP